MFSAADLELESIHSTILSVWCVHLK